MDIYFTPEYGKLYEEHEKATVHQISFNNEYGKVWYVFLVREIPYQVDGTTYYDILTPYGFGGPVIIETTDSNRLLDEFYEHFHEYCSENRIISEFIRFHPLANVTEREKFSGDVVEVGRQVIRDLTQPLKQNMSKSVRYNHRKALKDGISVQFDTTGEHLDQFLKLYYETMDRNEAVDYYYFSPQFFEKINNTLKGHYVYTHIRFHGEIIASGLALYGEKYAYAFLGGSSEKGYSLRSTESIEVETMKWMKDKGVNYYILGGGYGEEDGIYQFKKKFAKDSDYYYHIGKKIHNPSVYQRLAEKHKTLMEGELDPDFFPVYRSPLVETVTSH